MDVSNVISSWQYLGLVAGKYIFCRDRQEQKPACLDLSVVGEGAVGQSHEA